MDNPTMPYRFTPHHRETLRKTPPLFFALVGLFVCLALIPTLWPALDLQAAALFTGNPPQLAAAPWWWVETINLYVPLAFRVMVFIALALWLVASLKEQWSQWRLPLAFVVLMHRYKFAALLGLKVLQVFRKFTHQIAARNPHRQ